MAVTPESSSPEERRCCTHLPDGVSVHARFDRLVDALAQGLPEAAAHLDAAREDNTSEIAAEVNCSLTMQASTA